MNKIRGRVIMEKCPDCGRPKASSINDVVAGFCPKWWAIRDQAAEDDCIRVQAQPKDSADAQKLVCPECGLTEKDGVHVLCPKCC